MENERICIACSANLAGPLQPKISLAQVPPAEESEQKTSKVKAHAWLCLECGLVHWYAVDEDLVKLAAVADADEAVAAKPGMSYERRAQMLRMLRRVRRM